MQSAWVTTLWSPSTGPALVMAVTAASPKIAKIRRWMNFMVEIFFLLVFALELIWIYKKFFGVFCFFNIQEAFRSLKKPIFITRPHSTKSLIDINRFYNKTVQKPFLIFVYDKPKQAKNHTKEKTEEKKPKHLRVPNIENAEEKWLLKMQIANCYLLPRSNLSLHFLEHFKPKNIYKEEQSIFFRWELNELKKN